MPQIPGSMDLFHDDKNNCKKSNHHEMAKKKSQNKNTVIQLFIRFISNSETKTVTMGIAIEKY